MNLFPGTVKYCTSRISRIDHETEGGEYDHPARYKPVSSAHARFQQ